MSDKIREWLINIMRSRLFVFFCVIIVLFVIVISHLFRLQIVNGQSYQDNYNLTIEKEVPLEGSRGNIYDRNGILLAHNEITYTVTLEDSGTYANNQVRAKSLNAEINTLIDIIERGGDRIVNDIELVMDTDGTRSFSVSGRQLKNFFAEIYAGGDTDGLGYDEKLGYDTSEATPQQVYDYLIDYFGVDSEVYDLYRAYQIMTVRFLLWENSYQKYVSVDVATDVSDRTVAAVSEYASELEGVSVIEDAKRVYDYPEYFSHIIGYTGKISDEEYAELSAEDESYTINDIVGKSGIEQYMELSLQGSKGYETLYVDSLGSVLDVRDHVDPSAGDDVYLSIDAKLQMAVYDLLEQELAGIILSKLVNEKTYDDEDLYIPIYDVYTALVDNNVIDMSLLSEAESGTVQTKVLDKLAQQRSLDLSNMTDMMNEDIPYGELTEKWQDYMTYAVSLLQDDGIFDTDGLDMDDTVYSEWKAGEITVREYLDYAIDSSRIDAALLSAEKEYMDSDEIYKAMADYVEERAASDEGFDAILLKHMILDDVISGADLCCMLCEQNAVSHSEKNVEDLKSGALSAYDFIKSKIKSLDITPAQLALDPCTGSCVIMDPSTGELLACVSYPGYDTNRLSNNMDSEYYDALLEDASLPLYNNATQQTTAPGSTFKMVTASAGLSEGVIDTDTKIKDEGVYTRLDLDLKCWIYPSTHGSINVSQAIRYSCNYFFAEVGYLLSLNDGSYAEKQGLNTLKKYANMYGLGEATGIEIGEGSSKNATEYPIDASIGQSDNNYTTVQLARYISAIANKGTVYNLTLLSKLSDSDGNIIETYTPEVYNEITGISDTTWNALNTGMREVVVNEHKDEFGDLKTSLAGKTGTAQESEDRPNHALFVGYAPYDSDPEIAVAARIAYGYGSSNACSLVSDIVKYYFGEAGEHELITGEASETDGGSNTME